MTVRASVGGLGKQHPSLGRGPDRGHSTRSLGRGAQRVRWALGTGWPRLVFETRNGGWRPGCSAPGRVPGHSPAPQDAGFSLPDDRTRLGLLRPPYLLRWLEWRTEGHSPIPPQGSHLAPGIWVFESKSSPVLSQVHPPQLSRPQEPGDTRILPRAIAVGTDHAPCLHRNDITLSLPSPVWCPMQETE